MDFNDKNVYTAIVLMLTLLVITFFYNVYKKRLEQEDVKFSYGEIKRFLKQDHKKPILWIFIDYEKNARNWENFYSRNTYALNQGYIFLTVRTIVEKCKTDFHICLIDDNVFHKLLDDNMFEHINKRSNPNKLYVRIYGMCHLLYTYGGIFVPASFICFENLIRLNSMPHHMFVGEFKSTGCMNARFSASYEFMGCQKEHPVMKDFMNYLKKEIITDFTSEPQFVGKVSIWLNYNVKHHQITLICGKQLGTKKKNGNCVQLEELMSTDFVEKMKLKHILGIYIPQRELLQRIQYGWFVRMSAQQVLKSNTFIGKMLLINNNNDGKNSNGGGGAYPYFSIA
jgi:hypothetical protein